MIVAVLLIFPEILKKSDERYKEKRKKKNIKECCHKRLKEEKDGVNPHLY